MGTGVGDGPLGQGLHSHSSADHCIWAAPGCSGHGPSHPLSRIESASPHRPGSTLTFLIPCLPLPLHCTLPLLESALLHKEASPHIVEAFLALENKFQFQGFVKSQ